MKLEAKLKVNFNSFPPQIIGIPALTNVKYLSTVCLNYSGVASLSTERESPSMGHNKLDWYSRQVYWGLRHKTSLGTSCQMAI